MNPETIRALLSAFERSDWREMTVTIGGDRLYVSRDASGEGPLEPLVQPAPAERESAATTEVEAPGEESTVTETVSPAGNGAVIESPSVGLFWRAPSPGAPPFVEVGDRVSEGETVGIVEVMKLMNHVASPVAGVVRSILIENGGTVEYGQVLVEIEPED